MTACSGIGTPAVPAATVDCSSWALEKDSLFELDLRSTLLALLINLLRPGDFSPEPPAPPGAEELITGNGRQSQWQLRCGCDID